MIDLKNGGKLYVILSPEEWGAQPPKEKPDKHVPARIVIHHSFSPTAAQYRGIPTIQAIQRFHQDDMNWADIAYHYLMSPDGGTIFEGRPAETVGAHCGGRPPEGVARIFGNTGSIGICVIGDYDRETPDERMISRLIHFISTLKARYGIADKSVFGHCDAWSRPPKSCPGKNLIRLVRG